MKKLLLSLALVLGMASVATAADVTLPGADKTWSDYTWTQTGDNFTAVVDGYTLLLDKHTSSTALVSPDQYSIRVYAGAQLTITAPQGVTFNKVTVTINATGNKATEATASEGWTVSEFADGTFTMTSATPQTSITFDGAGKQLRVGSVALSADGEGDTPVTPPTPPVTGGDDEANVTLPAADKKWNDYTWTQSGDNYVGIVENYTLVLDKHTSTTALVSPDQYSIRVYAGAQLTLTAPEGVTFTQVTVTINATGNKATEATASEGWTVSEFADGKFTMTSTTPQTTVTFDGAGKQLRVATLELVATGQGGGPVTPPTPPVVDATEVANIEAFYALDKGTRVKFVNPVTVVWQHQSSLYLKDATGTMLCYGALELAYESGTTLTGFEGTVGEYNGVKQLTPTASTFTAGTPGTAVEPEEMMIEDVAADIVNQYVKFVGVTIAQTNGRNYTMTDATGTITLYQNWTDINILTGSDLVVVGFVGLYKDAAQILAAEVKTADGLETVATPTFDPAAGMVFPGTKVTISCATEGASIYYTLDGTEPTTASTLYTEPIVINEAVTVKAFAVKEGMHNSGVATTNFVTKTPVGDNQAEFNWADPSTLTPAYGEEGLEDDGTTGNKMHNVSGVVFTANHISIVNEGSGTAARLYLQSSGNWSYRFYKNTVTTISAAEGYKIVSVELEGQTSAHKTAVNGATYSAGTIADGILTIPDNETVTSLTITPTATIGLVSTIVTFAENGGVADVELDSQAPVQYFNLQGIAVEGDLTPGLYIRRQGNTATKVLVK